MISSNLLAVRTLNALRKAHLPTYVAARFLFDNRVFNSSSSWVSEVIPWKKALSHSIKYWKAPVFKGVDSQGGIDYRDFLIPSPTAALAEALVLDYFSQCPNFHKPNFVYSYIWPKTRNYPHSFVHYGEGYKKRNDDIKASLLLSPEKVAYVIDIEKFYPSIKKELVAYKINEAVDNSNLPMKIKVLAKNLIEQLWLSEDHGSGLATGPLLSHVVADFALKDIDETLSNKYPSNYFRYVDDIVILVKIEEVPEIKLFLETLFKKHELRINSNKTDCVTARDWLAHGPHKNSTVFDSSFESLTFKLKVFLSENPEEKDNLILRFKDNGFLMPFDRIFASSKSKQFTIKYHWLLILGWYKAIFAKKASMADLIEYSFLVRRELTDEFLSLMDKEPQGGSRRKWWLQRIRYVVNRLLYLYPRLELNFLVTPLARVAEFKQYKALLELLINGSVEELAKMPGSALNAGVAILREQGAQIPFITNFEVEPHALVESAAIISLYKLDRELQPNFDGLHEDFQTYLSFCSGRVSSSEINYDFSYLSEISALALKKSLNSYKSALDSKFSDEEEWILEALSIGEEYSY